MLEFCIFLTIMCAMDRIDRKILRKLVEQGRSTQFELAEAAALSPSAAARRQKALEESGLIAGYRADLNLRELGYTATVFISISLDSQSDEALSAFEEAAAACPSVLRCHLMSGREDYLLTVAARSIEDYERIHRQEIATLPRVARIETAFALREIVNRSVPPQIFADLLG